MTSSRIKSWFLALLPIIGIYSILGVNISNIFLVLLTLYGAYKVVQCPNYLRLGKVDKILLIFWGYTILISLINIFLSRKLESGDLLVKYAHISCFIWIIVFFRNRIFNKGLFINPFITVALISSGFLIIQFVLYNLIGIKLYGVLEAYRTNITDDLTRPSSFFIEPAHFCRYCILPLFVILFEDDSKRKVFKATFISIAIVLSQSSIGYIELALIWFFWVIMTLYRKKIQYKKIIKALLIIIPAVVICIWVSLRYELFDFFVEHVSGLDMREITSGNVRVFRGFWIWKEENILYKTFGVGYANVRNFLADNGIRTIFDGQLELGNEYMSAISYILVMNGIIGCFIFLSALFYLFYMREKREKVLILLFVVLMISNEEFKSVDFMNIWLYLLINRVCLH